MPKITCPGCGAEIDTETGLAEVSEEKPSSSSSSSEEAPEPELPSPPAAARRGSNRYRRS